MVRCIFQFTPLREGLLVKRKIFLFSILFQFTPLREGLLPFHRYVAPCTNFNSRPCERGFNIVNKENLAFRISIHAPARGASFIRRYSVPSIFNFNSRPCERGFTMALKSSQRILFQFTPLREGLPGSAGKIVSDLIFQFTPLREGLHSITRSLNESATISIHAPARGASLTASIRDGVTDVFQFTPLREGLHN